MKRLMLIFPVLLLLAACERSWQPKGEPCLVVEGWITDGGYPIVMVTTSVATDSEYQSVDDQYSHLVRWAKVTVSDGDNSVILTGMKNTDYFPPYIYTTSKIKGQAGKTYSLTVEYSGETVSGSTTIPQPVPLDAIEVIPMEDDGSVFNIKARFADPDGSNYYRAFVKLEGRDSTYLPSFLGCWSDEILGNPAEVQIMKGRNIQQDDSMMWDPAAFEEGEELSIRFCTMDAVSYRFWDSYGTISSLSIVPLFPATYNPEYNVEGGIGYWCGYGASYYKLTIEN